MCVRASRRASNPLLASPACNACVGDSRRPEQQVCWAAKRADPAESVFPGYLGTFKGTKGSALPSDWVLGIVKPPGAGSDPPSL